MRIPSVALYPIVPPIHPIRRRPKPDQPEEPISFCGHLNRLLEIHRRHLMLQRLWAMMTDFLHPQPTRFNVIA